jgi:hypothetical protein
MAPLRSCTYNTLSATRALVAALVVQVRHKKLLTKLQVAVRPLAAALKKKSEPSAEVLQEGEVSSALA